MKTLLALAVAGIGFVSTANAAITPVYSTTFSSPTYVDGPLNTSADTTTPGQDGWIITSGTLTNAISVSNAATTGTVGLTTTGQDVRRLFTAQTSGSVYLNATVNITAAQATGDYFLHLGDGGTGNFYARTFARSTGTGFALALNTSSGGTPAYGAELAYGTYNLLVRYDLIAGAANDTGALFVNPLSPEGAGDTAYATATNTGTDASSIASVNLRQGTTANAPTLTIDGLTVSIPVVPEPTSIAALALGGLLLRRRRA